MSETLKDKHILLVDDDHDILTSMQAAFEPTGAMVETASNGNKAVELAEKNQPDLVVLDMMLPGRSGFLVLEKIKAQQAPERQAVRDHDHRQPGRRGTRCTPRAWASASTSTSRSRWTS